MNEQATPKALDGERQHESQRAELSREMVRLYKDLFGRGPTKVKTEFAGPDTVICTLRESLTPAEKAMAQLGEHQRLRDTRTFFQHASEEKFRQTTERILGRRVEAFVSGTDTHEDVSSEVFYMEPRGETAKHRVDGNPA
jgi:uncharacterized protein YbcI